MQTQNSKNWNIADNTIIAKENQLLKNALKKSYTNRDMLEFKKIYILSPTINIANKQCYIFEPLKTNISNDSIQVKLHNKSNDKSDRYKISDGADKLSQRSRIKVRLKSINLTKRKNLSSDKRNNNKKITEKKEVTPIDPQRDRIIALNNNSNTSINEINQNNNNSIKNVNSSSNIFNSIQQNFQATKNNLLYNDINEACLKYNKSNDKSFKLLPNQFKEIKSIGNNRRITRYYYNKNNRCFYQINNYNKNTYTNQFLDDITFSKINTLKNIEIANNNKDIDKIGIINNLTERNKLINSNSMKSLDEDLNDISKILKKNIKNYDLNSMASPRGNKFQNTYRKKLIRRKNRGIDKTINNRNDVILDKSETSYRNNNNESNNTSNHKIKMKNMIIYRNIVNNCSLNNIMNSNDFNATEIFNKSNEKEAMKKKILLKKKLSFSISNNNLYSNNNYYNTNKEEKDDTKDLTDIKITSDKNYSTTNSFYNNNNNNNNNLNKNVIVSNQLKHKLKNLITSIDYMKENNENNDDKKLKINNNLKNIILYEVDDEGRVNYRVKKMENSVEKVVRDNSEIKRNSKINDIIPKVNNNIISLYVKKNQGTVLRKFKGNNKIEFYCPSNKKMKK